MADLRGDVDAVQEHVGGAEDVRQVLFLDAMDAGLEFFFILWFLDLLGLFTDVVDYRCQEAASAAGWVENCFPELWGGLLDHELGDGSRSVELARVAGRLQVFENLLVDVAEGVPFLAVVDVDFVDFVDDLPHQRAVFHVVVGVVESVANHGDSRIGSDSGQGFDVFEQAVVDEFEQLIAGESFIVGCPVPPAVRFEMHKASQP